MIVHDEPERGNRDSTAQGGADRLTETAYWDTIWQAKNNVRADFSRTHRSYVAAFTDHLYRRRLPQDRRWRFLEIGCGTGRWLAYFHHTFGYSVTGCDYSETRCATARQTLTSTGIPGTIVNQDLTWLLNRLCLGAFRRFGWRVESQRFSPYLYAIGERSAG